MPNFCWQTTTELLTMLEPEDDTITIWSLRSTLYIMHVRGYIHRRPFKRHWNFELLKTPVGTYGLWGTYEYRNRARGEFVEIMVDRNHPYQVKYYQPKFSSRRRSILNVAPQRPV